MADPYATPSQARTFYAGADTSGVALDVPMRNAARLVQRYAPVPDPEPADYGEMAADCELEVGRFLVNSLGGSVSSLSSEAGSLSLTNLSAVMGIVSSAMGDYYSGPTGSGSGNVGVVSHW